MSASFTPPNVHVGVGCIVMRDGLTLMVKNHAGYWSTPGGHLDFGESPADCAARETLEETGVRVSNVRFVAITNDVMTERGRHYVTIWMRGEPASCEVDTQDLAEIAEARWCDPSDLPSPVHPYLDNLMSGRCLPPDPPNHPIRSGA